MASTQGVGTGNSPFPLNGFSGGSARIDRFVSRNDTDGNGTLSLSEFEQIRQNLPGGSASSALSADNADSDGTTDSGSDAATLFGQIDTDGDGELTASELSAYRQKQITAANSALLNLHELFGNGEDGRSIGHRHRPPMDADSLADLSELTAATTASASTPSATALDGLFQQLDTDGSGAIGKGELSTFLVQAMAQITGTAASSTATTAASATVKTATA